MQAASPSSFDPAGAGGVLLGALIACVLIGAVAGILVGILAVYRRYGRSL
jgi:hypothetical protein